MSQLQGVLCAVRSGAETSIVESISQTSTLTVARRCADGIELLAAGQAGLGSIAVVSWDLNGLDASLINALHQAGIRVVITVDDTLPGCFERAERLGADLVVDEREDITAALNLLLAQAPEQAPTTRVHLGGEALASDAQQPSADTALDYTGQLVAVWGPVGSPGRTTVAVNLADHLAQRRPGLQVLLADADTHGGAVGQVLAILDEAPGMAAAVRAAEVGSLDLQTLANLAAAVDDVRVLTGITRASRWDEISAAGLREIYRQCRNLVPWTVVDCGASIEQDEALSYDTFAPQRNAATITTLQEADQIILVGTGEPVGLQRLLTGLDELRENLNLSPSLLVINQVDSLGCGALPERAVRELIEHHAPGLAINIIPFDRQSVADARYRGEFLSRRHTQSAANQALAGLAERVELLEVASSLVHSA